MSRTVTDSFGAVSLPMVVTSPLTGGPFPVKFKQYPLQIGVTPPSEPTKTTRAVKLSENPSSGSKREFGKEAKREKLEITGDDKQRSGNPFDVMVRILSLNEKNDPHVLSMLQQVLLQCDPASYQAQNGEFKYCFLVIDSMRNRSEKTKFRVLLSWTGLDVKSEISRYYSIPVEYQTIFINSFVISDSQTLENCDFRENNQIIYSFLSKKKISFENSPITVGQFLPRSLHNDVTTNEKSSSHNQETQLMDEDLELLRHQECNDAKTSSETNVRHNEESDLSSMVEKNLKLEKESGYFSGDEGRATLVCDGMKKKTESSKKRRKRKKNKRN